MSEQDGICDKNNAPSVSSISRVLRGGHVTDLSSEEGRTNHSIDGILGKQTSSKEIRVTLNNKNILELPSLTTISKKGTFFRPLGLFNKPD